MRTTMKMPTNPGLRSLAPRAVLSAGLAVICLTLIPGHASAISRYNATSMTCDQIHSAIAAEGEVVLRWTQPPDILRYDRYVAGNQFCDSSQQISPSAVPSASRATCVAFTCKHFEPHEFFFLLPPDNPTPKPRRR